MDKLAELLQRAVSSQAESIAKRQIEEEQERIDNIRFEIAEVCGYEKFLFNKSA